MTDPIRDAQNKKIEDGIAELERLGQLIARIRDFIDLIHLPRHVVPVFDGQYVQHQDRPWLGIPRDRYLYPHKQYQEGNMKKLTLEEAVEQAHEAKGEWLEAMMNWAVKNYEYKARKRLGPLAFLLDADKIEADKINEQYTKIKEGR